MPKVSVTKRESPKVNMKEEAPMRESPKLAEINQEPLTVAMVNRGVTNLAPQGAAPGEVGWRGYLTRPAYQVL
jgi:hypothetical protein